MEHLHFCFFILLLFAANLAPVESECSLFFNGSQELRNKLADYFDKNSPIKVLQYKLLLIGYPEDYLEPKIRRRYRTQEYGTYFLFLKIEEFTKFIPWFKIRDAKETVILRDEPQYCLKKNSTDEVEIIVRSLLMKDFGIDKTRKNSDIELSKDVKICLNYKNNQTTDFSCCFWDSTKEMKCYDLEENTDLSNAYRYIPFGLAGALLLILLLFLTGDYVTITFAECDVKEKKKVLNYEIISDQNKTTRKLTVPMSELMQKGKTGTSIITYLIEKIKLYFYNKTKGAENTQDPKKANTENPQGAKTEGAENTQDPEKANTENTIEEKTEGAENTQDPEESNCNSNCCLRGCCGCGCCWKVFLWLLQIAVIHAPCVYGLHFLLKNNNYILFAPMLIVTIYSLIISFCYQIVLFQKRYLPITILEMLPTYFSRLVITCDMMNFKQCRLIVSLLIPTLTIYLSIVIYVKMLFDVITYLFFEFEKLNYIVAFLFVGFVYFNDYHSKMNVELKHCLEDFESQLDNLWGETSASCPPAEILQDISTTVYTQVSYNKMTPGTLTNKVTLNQLVYFVDNNGNVYFSKKLFYACCLSYFREAGQNCQICRQVLIEILKLSALGLYLGMIVCVIQYFDKLYDLSNSTTFVAAFFGGLLPKIASPFLSFFSSKSEVKLRKENKRFVKIVYKTIKDFKEEFQKDSKQLPTTENIPMKTLKGYIELDGETCTSEDDTKK